MYKSNEKLISLCERAQEIMDYDLNDDFNTRGSSWGNNEHIVANIKVYDWLDETDVLKLIPEGTSDKRKKKILKEFNEERLNNIYSHVCEWEVECLKEQYEKNVDIDDPYYNLNLYRLFYGSDFKSWPIKLNKEKRKDGTERTWYNLYSYKYKEFEAFSKRKNNTPEDFWKQYKKQHKWEIEEWNRRAAINFDCWQFGRSGGWFSVCKANTLDFSDPDYFITNITEEILNTKDITDYQINQIIWQEDFTKKELVLALQEFVTDAEKKIETVKYYVNKIEEAKKHFKETLLDRLNEEIQEFISTQKPTEANTTFKVEDKKAKSSLGVTVPLEEFKQAYKGLLKVLKENNSKKVPYKVKVGSYTTEKAIRTKKDILVKAGCHIISLNQVKQIMA